MRVLIVCNDSSYFLRHRRIIADALAARGHLVTVITGGPPLRPGEIGQWRYRHTPVERFAFNPLSDTLLFLRTLRAIAEIRPHAVHLITLKPAVVSGLAAIAARSLGRGPRRIVVTIAGLGRLMASADPLQGHRASFARRMVEKTMRLLSRRRGVVFTFETHADREHWLSKGLVNDGNSLAISGAGVDPARFFPADLQNSSRPLRVLFASRLLAPKGLDAVLLAARTLAGEGMVQFLVAGIAEANDPEAVSPDELARDPAITFLGEITDMAPLLREVDVVCLPTRYGEGIPRILIEAAATGLPSIASDLPGCAEIVEHGVSGFLVPVVAPDTTAARIVEAVRLYASDRGLMRRHGEAARRNFLAAGFSQDDVLETFIGVLTQETPGRPLQTAS